MQHCEAGPFQTFVNDNARRSKLIFQPWLSSDMADTQIYLRGSLKVAIEADNDSTLRTIAQSLRLITTPPFMVLAPSSVFTLTVPTLR
jgi:hypothetical protein